MENVSLLIIDEISFAKVAELVKLHKQLSRLKETSSRKYVD